jgi:hypothetical protein
MSVSDGITKFASGLTVFSVAYFVCGFLVAVWIGYTYGQYRKLRHIKGPWIAAISPAWLFYHTCRGDLYLAVEAALKQYGAYMCCKEHT